MLNLTCNVFRIPAYAFTCTFTLISYIHAADSVVLPHCENVQVHCLIFKCMPGAGLVIMISVADLSVLSGVSVLIH